MAAAATRRFDSVEHRGRRLRVNDADEKPPPRAPRIPRPGSGPPPSFRATEFPRDFPPDFGEAPMFRKNGGSRRRLRAKKRSPRSTDNRAPRVRPEPPARAAGQRSPRGWRWADAGPTREQARAIAGALASGFGLEPLELVTAPSVEELHLPRSRCAPPGALAALCTTSTRDRAGHTYGKSFRDLVRGLRGEFPNPPDVVARPRTEDEVVAVLDWCNGQRAVVIPYGGGSSVVGGVEPPPRDDHPAVVSLDLSELGRVLEVDRTSRAARIQAGALGPELEEQLRPHKLTLRHFPQSFE